MSVEFDELQQRALQLSPAERADLAYRLLQSIDEVETDEEAALQAWIREAERRSAEIARGEAILIPGDEVFARLRQKFG